MEQPPGFEKGKNIVWALDCIIYGIMQGTCN